MEDIAALATETPKDSPVIRPVAPGGGIVVTSDAPGFVAGRAYYTWGGGLLVVYSLDGSRVYFSYTDASLYETPEQAAAMVAALTAVDKDDLKRATEALIVDLDFPPIGVSILGLEEANPVDLGDAALGRDYAFSASGVVIDVHELRFAARGASWRRLCWAACTKRRTPPPPNP